MSTLVFPNNVYQAIRAHGEETYPQECCGALLGRSIDGCWHIIEVVRTRNARAESARTQYEIAPIELVKIERTVREKGLAIAGFYHSHPDHPAQWSQTDLAEAHWLGCSYVITEVVHGKAAATNSFLLDGRTEEDKHFELQVIRVEN